MLYFLSILTFLFFIYFFSLLSKPLNLIDNPNLRKIHKGNIPLIGGLCIFCNFFLYSFYFNLDYFMSVIIYSSIIIFVLGLLDDSMEIKIIYRLIAQLIACLIVIGSGLSIENIGDYMYFPKIEIGILSVVITVLCVLGLTNSFNFMDGIDGLCSLLILISILSILFFGYFINNFLPTNYELLFVLSISILIFLIFNLGSFFKIFLGDSGSTTLGFIVSFLLIFYSQSYLEFIHPVLTIWCVTLIVFDFFSVFIRRIIRGVNPFLPDRTHLHHILLDLKILPVKSLIIIIFSSLCLNASGFFVFIFAGPFPSLFFFISLLIIYIFIVMYLEKKINLKIK